MNLIKVELEVPKESKEVIDAVVELIKDLKAKKDLTAILAENIAVLSMAIEGLDQIKEELKSKYVADLASYGAVQIGHIFK